MTDSHNWQNLSPTDRSKLLITEWMYRLRSIGGLKDFVDDKHGKPWAFECPEIEKLISEESTSLLTKALEAVGEDDTWKLNDGKADWASKRNQLRAEIRAKLAELRKE